MILNFSDRAIIFGFCKKVIFFYECDRVLKINALLGNEKTTACPEIEFIGNF